MSKFVVLFAALFCLSISVAAQDSTAESSATLDSATPASEPGKPAPRASLSPSDRDAWQLGVGFQYVHFKVQTTSFNDYGYNAAFTRYFSDRLGAEVTVIAGFGHATSSVDAKSVFVGGGPHFAILTDRKFEPFVHVIPGFERFRFTQGATLGSNNGFGLLAGGGIDYKFGGRASWRIQGDYVGSRVLGKFNSGYGVGTGIVFNF